MTTNDSKQQPIERLKALLDQEDIERLRDKLTRLLERPGSVAWLRALDAAGLLTRIIPELEPARHTDQPSVHFLPVLAHSIEAVAAVDWLLDQLQVESVVRCRLSVAEDDGPRTTDHGPRTIDELPAAVRTHPELRYESIYAADLRAHFAGRVSGGSPRAALFKLATLLHDVAKPQTKQTKPGGGVSFHEHQAIGGQLARQIARRLRFDDVEADYVSLVVREHMRPGQLAALDQVTLRAIRRFFYDTGDAGPDVLIHVLADHMATRGPKLNVAAWRAHVTWIDAMLGTIWGEVVEPVQPLVRGDDLIAALGIVPGPLVGRLLAAIGEAQASGDITTVDEAIALARRLTRKT